MCRVMIKFQNNTNCMFKRLLILFLIVLSAGLVIAVPVKKTKLPPTIKQLKTVTKHLKIDSAKITVRNFDTAAIKKYRSDPAFKYAETKTGITLWDRFWTWV